MRLRKQFRLLSLRTVSTSADGEGRIFMNCLCNIFDNNNIIWILIIVFLLLYCCGNSYGGNYAGGCGNGCGNGCGCMDYNNNHCGC